MNQFFVGFGYQTDNKRCLLLRLQDLIIVRRNDPDS
jgi:hypothetical protein